MDFIWNDGGRAACGFVGTTGDCVTRSIAIATGTAYREVYQRLGEASASSPRKGVPMEVASRYLAERRWKQTVGNDVPFAMEHLPKGIVIAHINKRNGLCNHLCTVVDRVVHDTWNPAEDNYILRAYWTPQDSSHPSLLPTVGPNRNPSKQQELTQKEFDRVMRILRALDKTANNRASTDAEKHNALRAMQELMLNNNLTRDDIEGDENLDQVLFTRMTCAVNGRRACSWEKELAHYVCDEILPTVQWYISTQGHRTLFTFYGPLSDVKNTTALFRELLLTIATAARLQYGGFSRGSGASYAEGYVAGLPTRAQSDTVHADGRQPPTKKLNHTALIQTALIQTALIQTRTLAIHKAAIDWLRMECHVRLTSSSRSGRNLHDAAAQNRGKQHGAQHDVRMPTAPKRIGKR